jgi:hypothetical protein
MTSQLNVDTIADKAGTGPVGLTKQSAAKAWVNFNGTGTIAADDSLNVSSLSDGGTGLYDINVASAFAELTIVLLVQLLEMAVLAIVVMR